MTYDTANEIRETIEGFDYKVKVTIKNGMVAVSISDILDVDSFPFIHRQRNEKGDIRIFNDGIIRTDSIVKSTSK